MTPDFFFKTGDISGSDNSLIYAESAFTPFQSRACTLELLFETFGFGQVYPCIEELALLHSHQVQLAGDPAFTGLVVNIKDQTVSVIPVVEGYIIPQGMYCHPFGHLHLISFIHDRLDQLNPAVTFVKNMQIQVSSRLKSPYSFLNLDCVNRKLFRLSQKLLRKFCKISKAKDSALERKILVSKPKTIDVEKRALKIDASALHVYEAFFCPELFELPEDLHLTKGILDALANVHSDLKRKVLSVERVSFLM